MPRKAVNADENGRGSCCSLEAVKHYLQSDTIPEGYTKNDKRALRRRAKSFVLIGEELYFTGGRSRHNKGLIEREADGIENPENEPDHTQILRKVVFSEEEQQEIVNRAHVGEDGSHHGMEKTTECVSNDYYWMRIIHCVRTTIRNCLSCNSRIKTSAHLPAYPAGHESSSPSAVGANTSVLQSGGEEIVGRSEQVADDIDVSIGDDGFSVLSVADSYSVKQEVDAGTTDVFTQFTAPKQVCSHFWQKVEMQIFGPYQAGKKQVYVVVALDSYSQFPEAVTMEVLSSATLTNFFLNLFCRYGTVEKLLLLQNQVTRSKDLFINLQDLLQAGIAPSLLFPHVNPLDERWTHIEKSLVRFISLYPDLWFHCLEAFLVPLRITLPPEAVYSPYYLVHGREAPVPEQLSQVYSGGSSGHTEVQLTEDQEKQTVDMVTAAYGIHSDNPSFPVTLPEPASVKSSTQVVLNQKKPLQTDSVVETERQQQKQGEEQAHRPRASRNTSSLKRKCGRKPKLRRGQRGKEVKAVEEKVDLVKGEEEEVRDSTEIPCDAKMDAEDDCDRDSNYEPEIKTCIPVAQPIRSSGRQRKVTYKAQASELFAKKPTKLFSNRSSSVSSEQKVLPSAKRNTSEACQEQISETSKNRGKVKKCKVVENTSNAVPPKKKRGRPCKSVSSDTTVETTNFTKMKFGVKKVSEDVQSSVIKKMQQLPLDTFYFIIRQYLEHAAFPPGISSDAKQTVSRLCSMFDLKDGKLYSSVGKSAGRQVVTGEKTRFCLLRKAHARGEMHHGRSAVLKHLSDLNVFWNGMSLDLDAFIHCCPECTHHNPLGNLPSVHIPSKSASLTVQGRKEDEPHMSEDEEEESSYEDLIQFLTDTTFPPSTTPRQQERIQERSQSFRIIKGSLHYQTPAMADPLQVLFSDSLKHAAIQEAHIEKGCHLSQPDTQARLRGQYFWSGMTVDVVRQVLGCCLKEALATAPVLHRNPLIQDRVHKIRAYYTQGVPRLDTSALAASEITSRHQEGPSETLRRQQGSGDSPASDCDDEEKSIIFTAATGGERSTKVVKAVEDIIEEIGKSLRGEAVTTENSEGKQAEQSVFGSVRSRKDAHKCQYCGKFVSGNVAYRIHLYKHTGVKPFNCSTCGKSFTTSKSLRIHTRKHTGIKPYLCNQCGREFFRGTSFKYHLKTHNRTQMKPLPCNECSRTFLTQNRLDKHKQYKHPSEPKVYMCEHCGKVFMHARSLKIHEQSHSSKHPCQVCKKEFHQPDQLDSHFKVAHTDSAKSGQKTLVNTSTPTQSQDPLQPHLLPHILYTSPQTQLVQTIDLNMSHISEIQWREDEHQQTPQHIIITAERPTSPFIIAEHAGSVMEQVNHISFGKPADGGITISSSHAGDPITITEHPDSQMRAAESAAVTDIAMDQHHMPETPHQMKADLGSYHPHPHTHTPSFSQSPHTTTHILTQIQLPLSTSQTPPIQHSAPSSTAAPPPPPHLQSLHSLQPAAEEVLLQQGGEGGVPVQYEVECLQEPSLTEADLNAVHLLAQASMAGQGMALRQAEEF